MSTKETYLELWDKFEKILKEKNLTIENFAKKWEEGHPDDINAIYRTFVKKIKAQQERRYGLQRVNSYSLTQIKEYIKFININLFTLEFKNIDYNTWFD